MLTEWISALDGQSMRKRSFAQWKSVCVGCHRFAGLPDYVEAPKIDYHYISVTLGGPLNVEGILAGGRLSGAVRPGQVIIMAANQDNVWRWSAPTEEAHVFLDPTLLQCAADEVGCGRPEVLNHCALDDEVVRCIVMEMAGELDQQDQSSRVMVETGAHYLAHRLLRHYCAKSAESQSTYGLAPSKIRKLESFAAERLGTSIGLAELAAEAGLSSYHFARSFKKAVGETPHTWLTRKRMERARDLLKTSSISILEIAELVGFESQSHFGQVFRKWAGMTPSAFRQATERKSG